MSFKPKYKTPEEVIYHVRTCSGFLILWEEYQRAYKEIEKLTEALEWYANEDEYWTTPIADSGLIFEDKGQRAREALGETKDNT